MRIRPIIALIILLVGCSSSSADSPEQVVRTYWEAIKNNDYEEAWSVICEKQKAEITKEQFVLYQEDISKERLYVLTGIMVEKAQLNGDEAVVPTTLTAKTVLGEREKKDTCRVLNEDGTWRFALTDRFIKEAKLHTGDEETIAEILVTVTHGSVSTMSRNWDADAEDDGFIVYPDLKNAEGETVKFEGIELPVKIEVFTVKQDKKWRDIKDRFVYSGAGSINSWEDGNPFFSGSGIKVPYEQIKIKRSDKEYGIVYATVTLPDGRIIEAKDDFVRIKPEPN